LKITVVQEQASVRIPAWRKIFLREWDKILSEDLKNHGFDVIFNQEHDCF